MPHSTVVYAGKGHIGHITLNRPEAQNAVNRQMAYALKDICCQINQDTGIYAVIITGDGETFCCGNELERAQATGKAEVPPSSLENVIRESSVATSLASIKRPAIVAINGDALGQGLELALSGDIRVASQKARFGFPQVSMGLIPVDGGTQRLPRIVGRGKALELILSAETIDAEEALAIGLVNKVVAEEDLDSHVEALAKAIATRAPIALQYAKEAVSRGLDLTLDQGLHLEADLYSLLQTTYDRQEGIKAFLEKRRPEFRGE